jgi:hypothetical protein
MTIPILKDGQNTPTANLPMGGYRHTNVGAPVSGSNYIRAQEVITQVPIYVEDAESADATKVSVSASFYATVSANQAPPGGSKLCFHAASDKSASCVLYLNAGGGTPYSANIVDTNGGRIWPKAMVSGGIYDVVYSSAQSSWQLMNPSDGVVSISANVKICENVSGSTLGITTGVSSLVMMRSRRGISFTSKSTIIVSVSVANNDANIIFSSPEFAPFRFADLDIDPGTPIHIVNNNSASPATVRFRSANVAGLTGPGVWVYPIAGLMEGTVASVSADVSIRLLPFNTHAIVGSA